MNPELDRRFAELADAAARATSGIDPAVTLAVFRRRRRARAAASTVAAAAAVVGLALGASQLLPDPEPPATTAPPTRTATPSPQDEATACGLALDDGLVRVTGVDTTARLPEDAPTDALTVRLLAETMGEDGELSVELQVTLVPGPWVTPAGPADVTYTVRAFAIDASGRVVGHAEPWDQPDGLPLREHALTFTPCAGEAPLAERVGETLTLFVAAVRAGLHNATTLTVSDPMPFTVAGAEPETTWLDVPGSCGDWADTHLLSETEGAMLGLAAELMDLEVARDGSIAGYVVIRNDSEYGLTGGYALTQLRVEMRDGPYKGSVLTLPGSVDLSDEVSIAAGGVMRAAIDTELDACGDEILPLPAGTYDVSIDVDLVTPAEPIGFSSPPVEVTVD